MASEPPSTLAKGASALFACSAWTFTSRRRGSSTDFSQVLILGWFTTGRHFFLNRPSGDDGSDRVIASRQAVFAPKLVCPELKLRAEQPRPAKSGLSARLSGRSGRFQRPLTAQPGGSAPGNPAAVSPDSVFNMYWALFRLIIEPSLDTGRKQNALH